MTLNDFKALDGDRATGVNSLPVTLGPERAARLACVVMAVPQVAVILALAAWDRPVHAAAILALLLLQGLAMRVLLRDPKGKAPWYNGTGVTLYVAGMMVAAFALAGAAMTLVLALHRPARPRADGAGGHRGADHLDAQPADGGRARPPGGACRACWWRCTTASRSPARPGASPPTPAATGRAGSSAAWRRWRCGGFGAALGVVGDPGRARRRAGAVGPRLCADRPRRRCLGHVAAGAARHRHRGPTAAPRRRWSPG